jgi:hypothetical protein
MSRRSSPRVSKNTPARTPRDLQAAPSNPAPAPDLSRITLPPRRRWPFVVLIGILLVLGVSLALIASGWTDRSFRPEAARSGAIADPERDLCEQFRLLKNAGDPSVDDLLAPLPIPPEKPISQEEAARFQADCFLHQDIRILAVRRDMNGPLVLDTKGNVSAPPLEVRIARGVDRVQRTMVNPDLIVEVRDGKIHGLRAEMHTGR